MSAELFIKALNADALEQAECAFINEANRLYDAARLLETFEEALRNIAQIANYSGAPIDTKACNYYAGNCQGIHEIATVALAQLATIRMGGAS